MAGEVCSACNGSGYYDTEGSPPCAACGGTGKEKRKRFRKQPYTTRGIGRVPCVRCGKPSTAQWNICALGGAFRGVCTQCDIELNALVLEFMKVPGRANIIKRYERGKQ